jgi:seryl-tRNA synthetase
MDTSDVARRTFRDELLDEGLLVATGVPGVYGRSDEFEDTVLRVDRLVDDIGAIDRPEVLRFPPLLPRTQFARSGFLKSFPHLVGTIHGFAGDDADHREVLRQVDADQDWSATFEAADIVLTPAACYPVYPLLAGVLPSAGRLVDVMSYCFRREPSDDAARMQMFRMHEHVRASDPEGVASWRTVWRARARHLIERLGLEGREQAAADPFFGRSGRLLADSQRDLGLKLEIVAPIASRQQPTAIISLNCHQDHFGRIYGIRTPDGAVAHTACVGFGLERIALALYRRHGFRRNRWPSSVLELMEL